MKKIYLYHKISPLGLNYLGTTTNEMFEKIKTFKEGDSVGSYVITKVLTEVENDYYHSVRLTLKKGDKESFHDVFSLCAFYYDIIFQQ